METLGKFLAFVGKLLALNWESYFKGSGQFFQRVAEAPGSSIFEVLFCLFLLGRSRPCSWGSGGRWCA